MPSIVYTLYTDVYTDGFSSGWSAAFEKVYNSLDLAGEAHACEQLGLDKGCLESYADVKRAYRSLALEYHPDKQSGASEAEREAAELQFREVQKAYEHLHALHTQQKKRQDTEEKAARRPSRSTR